MTTTHAPSASPSLLTIAIVGATGAVGREMLAVLDQRKFKHGPVKLLASPRSAGSTVDYRGQKLKVEALDEHSFDGVKLALFSAGSGVSKQYGPIAARAGALVVDNSSAFRMHADIPLVVPEVNPEALPARSKAAGAIIANPNCSAIILLMALTPLRRAFGIDRVVVSTYQAASGAGAQAMAELSDQTRDVLAGKAAVPKIFKEPYAFNLFSHNTAIDPASGLNNEEQKVIEESRKIWNDANVKITPTCIRVPVLRAHSQSINVTLSRPATLEEVREAIRKSEGVRLVDDRAANDFPTPLKASGGDDVLVGRLREDPSQMPAGAKHGSPTRGFDLFIAGDQLRKGAALNAVQIAEKLLG